MKVMQVVPRMDVGGVERGVVDLARYFNSKEVEIVVVSSGGRLIRELQARGIKHYRLRVDRKSILSFFEIRKLRKIIEKESIDIVHARSRVPAWISFFATRATSAQFITTAHGLYSPHFFSRVMGWGKFVICPSQTVAKYMVEQFKVPVEKIVIINRWVNLEKFSFSDYKEKPRTHVVVAIGRLSPSKGYEYLIEAFRKLTRLNPYIHLHIIGEAKGKKSKYLTYLKSLISRYALNYNVKFLGYKSEIGTVLRGADLLVVPSVIEESFGRVVVEAFASGVPVVATKSGALTEIIDDGIDGLLVPPRDSRTLQEAMSRVINNPDLAYQFTLRAKEKVDQHYTLSYCASKVKETYQRTHGSLRILVIKISSLGDIILALPSLKELSSRYPSSTISVLTLKRYALLFHQCPYINEVISIEEDYKRPQKVFEISRRIRRRSFDYIIDFQNSSTSHLITFLSLPRFSFGYARKFGFLLHRSVSFPRKDKKSPLDSQEEVLKLLGVTLKEKKLCFWDVRPAPLKRFGIEETDEVIGINVSASRKWQSKDWPHYHIKKFMEMVAKEFAGIKIVLFGDEASIEIAKKVETKSVPAAINLCGKTALAELPSLIKRLRVFITPDTATLHLAQALGIPTIGLFGPTDPARHVVRGENLHVICKKIECSHCYSHRCKIKTHECMEKIAPQEVFLKLKQILGR